MDITSYLLGKKSGGGGGDLDWNAIGYSTTPEYIQISYNYAKQVYDNWVPTEDLTNKFKNDTNLIFMPLVDTSTATNTSYMFNGCVNMLNVPTLNISNSLTASNMFNNCNSLYSIGNLDFSNVKDTQSTFAGCTKLTILPEIDLSSSTNAQYMFSGCFYLKNVKLKNTQNVQYFYNTFRGTENLENAGELNFSSANRTYGLQYLFSNGGAKSLTDEGLDNILKSCLTAPANYSTKTLAHLGFGSSVASVARIQALPHYQDFIDAGWTIGY